MSGSTEISAHAVVTPDGVVADRVVTVDQGVIRSIEASSGQVDDIVLAPGFVDLQVNGIDDVSVWSAEGADWDRLDERLVAGGTTTWCPTLPTGPLDRYDDALDRIARARDRRGAGPEIVGVHLEGPFLGACPGAHDPDLIRPADLAWLTDRLDGVAMMTIAPESPEALTAITRLAEAGVLVSIGHTDAGALQVEQAIRAGARMATHLFNAMPPFHHRDPGTVGAVLTEDALAASLIADLAHVHPRAIALAFRAKPPGRIVLVTDAVAWRGEGRSGVVRDEADGAARRVDGTLAGSTVRMDRAVRNCVLHARVDVATAVRAASTTPAELLGLGDRGRIEVGARADLVALDPETFEARQVWSEGNQLR